MCVCVCVCVCVYVCVCVCVFHMYCSVQLSMSNMVEHYRNKSLLYIIQAESVCWVTGAKSHASVVNLRFKLSRAFSIIWFMCI